MARKTGLTGVAQKAYREALDDLKSLHPEDWARLHAARREAAGLSPQAMKAHRERVTKRDRAVRALVAVGMSQASAEAIVDATTTERSTA